MQGTRNVGLDIFRACAILSVISTHLVSATLTLQPGIWAHLGRFGVDLFFALSGFLIGTILIQIFTNNAIPGRGTIKKFFRRRFLRTMPMYFFMLLVNVLLYKYVYQSSETVNWKYFFFLQNMGTNPGQFFGESWSLCVEEWFYLTFTIGLWLFMLFTHKIRKSIAYKILAFIIGYIIIFTCLRVFTPTPSGQFEKATATYCRLDAIAYGVLAALCDKYCGHKISTYASGIMGAVLTAAGVLLYLYRPVTGGWYIFYFNLAGIGLAMLVLFVKQLTYHYSPTIYTKPVTFISKISYSLYLLNLPVLFVLQKMFPQLHGYTLLMVCIFVLFLLAYTTYRFIERPFLRLQNSFIKLAK